MATARAARAYARQRAGRLVEAEADALRFRPQESSLADPSVSAFALIAGAVIIIRLIEAGNAEAAAGELERVALIPHDPDALLTQPFREARARLALALGEVEQAREHFDSCRRRQERWAAVDSPVPVQWRTGAAEACLAGGNRDEAGRLAREALEVARRFGAPRAIGVALRVQGLAEARRERRLRCLEESVAALERSSDRLEHTRSVYALGAELRRNGRRLDSARSAADGDARAAVACGAEALADEARRELLASGEKVAPVAASGPASLTPSELRVAEAAAAGRSNREIAQALFLSVKTVEMHLSNSYRKLDIGSRRDLEGVLEQARQSS